MQPNLSVHGIVPPLVTPLQAPDQLDEGGLERLVHHVLDGGVHGLFLLGTTGEAPSLSYRLRRELVQRVCGLVGGRVPVLVGITDTAFVESVSLARFAAEQGASAVVMSTPYYFPAGQTELISYVRHMVAELPLPLVLYNMPSLTKVWFDTETLQVLSELETIVGVKDSSGDLEYFGRLASLKSTHRPDWSVMIGPEAKLPDALALGGDGSVAGGANVFPRLFVTCYDAIRRGDTDTAARLHATIVGFQEVYHIGKYASRIIKATKCCLSLLGICDDCMAEPFHHFLPPERARVRAILEELNLAQGEPQS